MKYHHYTSPALMALIMKEGEIQATEHEGFRDHQVSLVPFGDEPTFYWPTGAKDSWLDKGNARVTVDLPEARVRHWASVCRSVALVLDAKSKATGSERWAVHAGPVGAEAMVSFEIRDPEHGWLHIDEPTLRSLLSGVRIKRMFNDGRKPKEVTF